MNGTSVVTNCGIAPRREVLVPGDEESSAAASLHGLRNSLNPWPLRTEEGTIVQPHLIPLRDVEIPAPMVITVNPRQVLKDGVRRAFFGRTDSIDDALWNGVRARLRNMTLGEARGIWQTIANEVAVDCFGEDGEIDVVKLRRWMEFLGDAENFRTEPYRFIPHAELMRSQMHRVCECLWTNKNGSRDRLDAANGIPVGEHGQSILATMSNGREPPLRPAEVIVASLFTPHRQEALPTCAICSLINAEIRNHPERLIKMYTQMLSSDQFTFPSGYAVRQQPIVDGFITIDLANGGKGR
ncbi:MAG: hypothetical protein LBS22_01800, partial [Puniceicoccales bacterium]|nr:hypothetical protein [Puniceicoccales bacterium]